MKRIFKVMMYIATAVMILLLEKGGVSEVRAQEVNADRFLPRSVTVYDYASAVAAVEEALADHAPSVTLYGQGVDLTGAVYEVINATAYSYGRANLSAWGYTGRRGQLEVSFEYFTTADEEIVLDSLAQQFVVLTEGMTDYQKVRYVHDFLCNLIVYDHDTVNGLADYRSAFDAFAYGRSVCSGYAMLFQRIMDTLNVPCRCWGGYINGGGAHMWNIVNLDGLWYHMDATWADQLWGISYSYFLIGTDRMTYPQTEYLMAPVSYPY